MFDQTNDYITVKNQVTGLNEQIPDDTPIRYSNNGTTLGYCFNDTEETEGRVLNSGSIMMRQKSCKANTGNSGNWYSFPGATVGGNKYSGKEANTICPKNWVLNANSIDSSGSYYYVFNVVYDIKNNGEKVLHLPFSLVYSGIYRGNNGSYEKRSVDGHYWSSIKDTPYQAYGLYFNNDIFNSQYNSSSSNGYGYTVHGYSLRCGESAWLFSEK